MTKKHINVSRWVDNVDVQVLPVLRVVGTKPMTSLKEKWFKWWPIEEQWLFAIHGPITTLCRNTRTEYNTLSQYTDRIQHSVAIHGPITTLCRDTRTEYNTLSQYTDRLQHSVTTTVSWMVQSLILVWIYCYVLNDVTTRNVTVFGQFGTTSCM